MTLEDHTQAPAPPRPGFGRRHRCSILVAVLAVPLLLVTVLLCVAVLRAVLLQPPQSHVLPGGHVVEMIDTSAARERIERLAGALRIKTVSYEPGRQEFQELIRMREYLETSFPLIHGSPFITREVINEYSLLYTVRGASDNNATLPYLLASHFDVVPADPATWEVPPFSGTIVNDTYLYGRGAMDDKSSVLGALEALEYMLQAGDRPRRSFFLAFGHDEEVGGSNGAGKIAARLLERGVTSLDFIYDEGMPVAKGLVPGVEGLVAMVGVTEKGYATLTLTVTGSPGHSSFPPAETSIGVLAAAVARLEQNPLPSMFGTGPERQMFEQVAPHSSFFYRLLYSNMWMSSGVMSYMMQKKAVTNAIVRTTTAVTMFNAGVKENVIAASATAVVNFRIHPSQSVADVVAYVMATVADPRVVVAVRSNLEAAPVSPCGEHDLQYQVLATTFRQTFDVDVVVPAVVIGNTDTKWYLDFTRHIFRSYPFVVTLVDSARLHGVDERLSLEAYDRVVNFFYRLIKNADLAAEGDGSTSTTRRFGVEF